MSLLLHALRRLLQMVPTIVLVALLMFGLMRLLPGDPALAILGDRATPQSLAILQHQMGLDRSIADQFLIYLRSIVTLQFGQSVVLHAPVGQLVAERLPVTLMLTAYAAVISILISVPMAFLAALRPNGWLDTIIRTVAQVGLSTPVFYVGLLLLIFLAARLGWFPVGGIGTGFFQDLYYLFLPALTLAISLAAILMRNLRISLIEVLNAEFVAFATAKGLRRRIVLGRHVLRNALVSTITLFGLQIGGLVGGAVITEAVFGVPGVGALMIESIFSRDYQVVQGLAIVLAVMVSLVFLAVDILQMLLDPRVAR